MLQMDGRCGEGDQLRVGVGADLNWERCKDYTILGKKHVQKNRGQRGRVKITSCRGGWKESVTYS